MSAKVKWKISFCVGFDPFGVEHHYVYIYLSIYRSIYLPICLSIYLSIYLSIHPSIHPSKIHPSIHPSINYLSSDIETWKLQILLCSPNSLRISLKRRELKAAFPGHLEPMQLHAATLQEPRRCNVLFEWKQVSLSWLWFLVHNLPLQPPRSIGWIYNRHIMISYPYCSIIPIQYQQNGFSRKSINPVYRFGIQDSATACWRRCCCIFPEGWVFAARKSIKPKTFFWYKPNDETNHFSQKIIDFLHQMDARFIYIYICGTGFWGLFRSPGYIRPPSISPAPKFNLFLVQCLAWL